MVQIVYLVNYGLSILMMNHIIPIKKLVSSQIKMIMLFNTRYIRKKRTCDRKIDKAMRIIVDIHERNYNSTLSVTISIEPIPCFHFDTIMLYI